MNPTILVLHQGAIGDFALTMAVVQAVREFIGGNHAIAIASATSARISAGRSVIDEWHSPETLGLHCLFSEAGELDERLCNLLNRADLVLNFVGDSESLPHRRLADHCRVISTDSRPTAETENVGRHITDQWAEAIRSMGLNIGEPSPPRIRIDAHGEKNRFIIHPGSGGRGKCWPVENFIRIADSLADRDVNWMLGPAELESAVFDEIRKRQQVICEQDLLAALQRIAGASLYVGNDAGMTHLAAAIGLRTIAIFGPTDPRVWRPLGPNAHVIKPLQARTIDRVSVDQVLAAIDAHLQSD